MCCQNVWKRLVPFVIALMLGVYVVNIFYKRQQYNNARNAVSTSCWKQTETSSRKLKIISSPKANYTESARNNQTQGTVTLQVTFLANGEIGDIAPVNSLPDGLTEQAVEAAKTLKFEPAMKDGKVVTVVKQVQYTFTLY